MKLNSVGVRYGGRAGSEILHGYESLSAYRVKERSDHTKARPVHQNAPGIANILTPTPKKWMPTNMLIKHVHQLPLGNSTVFSWTVTGSPTVCLFDFSQGGAAAGHRAGRRWLSGV